MLNKLKGMGFRGFLVNLTYSLDPRECRPEYVSDNRTICYFGRLSSEKGIYTLFQAIKGLNVNLKVIGAGPAESALRARAREEGMTNVRFLGYLAGDALKDDVNFCSILIVPSDLYENYPNSFMVSFALV